MKPTSIDPSLHEPIRVNPKAPGSGRLFFVFALLLGLAACAQLDEPQLLAPPSGLEGAVHDERVVLSWQASAASPGGYHVYRAFGDGAPQRLTAEPHPEPPYLDALPRLAGVHRYWVTAVDASGQESAMSASTELLIEPGEPCYPRSSLPCSRLRVAPPFALSWQSQDEALRAGSLADGRGVATGFTMVDPPSNRLPEDGPVSDPALPGFEPERLEVLEGGLELTSGKGIQYREPGTSTATNALLNALGVGVDASQTPLRIETTLLSPRFSAEGQYQQAGLWFGLGEDDYVKLVLIHQGEGRARVQFLRELGAQSSPGGDEIYSVPLVLGANTVLRLALLVDPATREVQAGYRLNGEPWSGLGSFIGVPQDFFAADRGVFTGIMATHRFADAPVVFRFGEFSVLEDLGEGLEAGEDEVGERVAWTTVAPSPIGRVEMQGAVAAGELYVFGGYTSWLPYTTTSEAYAYNPALDAWRRLAPMPGAWTHAGVVVDEAEANLYLAGAYVNPNTGDSEAEVTASAEVTRYSVAEDRWYQDALPPLPEARGAGGFVRLGQALHFFGGHDAARLDRGDHWTLSLDDPAAGWQPRAALPVPRNHLGYAVLDGAIYAIGGQLRYRDVSETLDAVHRYDPETDRWEERAPLPYGLSHQSAATFVHDGRVVVVGGEYAHNNFARAVLAYDPAEDAWLQLTSLPERRNASVAGAIDGAIFSSGGGHFSTTTYRGTLLP